MKFSEWKAAPPMDTPPAPPAVDVEAVSERHLGMALGILKEIEPLGDAARDLRHFCEEWARQAREGTSEDWIAPKRAILGTMIESLGVLYAKPLEGWELRGAIVELIKEEKRRALF